MAITENTYTGDGSTVLFSFTFPYLETTDIKVSLNGVNTTAYTLANATTVQFNTAPANGAAIRIYRQTDDSALTATFSPGSAIRSQDLNDNFTQSIYVTQESNRESSQAVATANTALSTATTASANASTAVSTANTASTNASNAVSTANTAATNAASAVTTANSAATNAATALSTANSATTTANTASASAAAATSTANTASSNAATAVSTANSALSAATSAVNTANTASSNATTAVNTANTASTNASAAVSTANAASTTANAADTKADAAIAAVSSSVNYTPVANVASIPASPSNNTYIEITNSTGLESFTPLLGKPVGFIGDSGLAVRLRYTTSGATWNWLNYYASDADSRYLKKTGGTMTGKITLDGNPSSNLHAATKQYVDGYVSALQGDINTTSATASAALPKAGGTMTGNIVFNAGQAFPSSGITVGSTTVPGIVQLTDSTGSTSTTTAATPNSVKTTYDLASTANTTANAALPKAGGTMTGAITFAAGQSFPGAVTSVSGTAPISVTGTTTPTVSVSAASTSASGVVQLSDSTSSTSSSTAATSAAVKSVQDFAQVVSTTANAAMPKAGGTFTGDVTFFNNTTKATNLQHASAASPAIVLAADGSATAQLSSINGGPLAGSRNRIINGDMRIDQRNAGASVTINTATYTVDRWYAENNGVAGKYSVQQNAGAVTPPGGFTNYLGATSLTAHSLISSDNFTLQHRIEGFNSSDIAWGTSSARSVVLSFWVRSSLTGSFGGSLILQGSTARTYAFSYSISSANTWTYVTVSIPGDTFANTIPATTAASSIICFSLGAGSSITTSSANSWQTGSFVAPSGSVNVVSTNGATFYITGVQLEPGTVATPFERIDYSESLRRCQRYFYLQKNYMGQSAPYNSEATGAIAQSTATALVYRAVRIHPVEMRATPSVTWANLDFWDGGVQRSVTGINNNNSSLYTRSVDWNMTGNMSGLGRPAYEFMQPSGFIACSAEL